MRQFDSPNLFEWRSKFLWIKDPSSAALLVATDCYGSFDSRLNLSIDLYKSALFLFTHLFGQKEMDIETEFTWSNIFSYWIFKNIEFDVSFQFEIGSDLSKLLFTLSQFI